MKANLTGAQALKELRKEHQKTLDLCTILIKDRDLQLQCRTVSELLDPLYTSHCAAIHKLRTQTGALSFAASQASGSWAKVLHEMTCKLADDAVLQRLAIVPALAFAAEPMHENEDQARSARRAVYLLVELLSQRAWSMSMHTETFPDSYAALFHEDASVADASLARIREVWSCILALERLLVVSSSAPGGGENPQPRITKQRRSKLQSLLRDVAYHNMVVNREFLAELEESDWSRSDENIMYLGWSLFARPSNTKAYNEDVFNGLRRKEEEFHRNKRMNRWSKYHAAYHVALARQSEAAKRDDGNDPKDVIKPMALQKSDWLVELPTAVGKVSDGMFVSMGHKPAPTLCLKELAASGSKAWMKKSGYQANWRSAAATRFLVHAKPDEWAQIDAAWTGAAPSIIIQVEALLLL